MDTSTRLITEVSRNTGDNQFSMIELFDRYFNKQPLCFCQAGATDLYDRPTRAGSYDVEDGNGNPQRGPEELAKANDKLIQFLKDKGLPYGDIEVAKYLNYQSNHFSAFVIFTGSEIIAQVRVVPGKQETLTSLSVMGRDENHIIWKELVVLCKDYIDIPPPHQDHINIITMSDNDFYLKSIPLVNKNQEFSYDFYNDDFQPISERVIKTLMATDECGLVLFHGDPGTGKTSYLKYLLHTVTKKKLIYLPPDLIQSLSAPSFISFLMSEASNSVLLIEDAENVLKHREAGGNQAVSNILNISDGILGDVLRLQIVCTFNSALAEIDPALLRPGRLISEYRFEPLTEEKTSHLLKKLHGDRVLPVKPKMTLAEIFNTNKMPDKTKVAKTNFGFIPAD